MTIFLYNMIMNYYNDIEIISFNHSSECKRTVEKYFNDYYVLDYNHDGELYLQVDDGPEIKLNSPVVWFTFPGPFFRFKPPENGHWDHRYICFKGSRVKKWIESGLLDIHNRAPVYPIIDPERFSRHMDELLNYLCSPTYGPNRAAQMLEGLLLQLHEQHIVPPAISLNEKKVSGIIDAINQNPEKNWDLKKQARRIGISYSHFRLIFQKLTGLSSYRYINRQRMEKAARLLRENQLEIKEISSIVGYDDIFHFAKLFKQFHRLPPGRFRDQSLLK